MVQLATMNRYDIRTGAPQKIRKALPAYPELLQDLLFARGIETEEDAEAFLNPDYTRHLHDPFLIKDMDKAVKRILLAIKNNEKTVIYSDYDADGIPGAVVLHDFFKKIGFTNFTNYIPHRHTEGFGLHKEAIDTFATDDVKLLITIDCGIADVAEAKHAKEKGIDLIITDHHICAKEVPDAFAILNSKQDGCSYPFRMLAGSGVVFKLVQALIERGTSEGIFTWKPGQEKWLLDMVGIATLSDMVPLRDENRVLAHYGLKVLRRSPRPGLVKLLKEVGVNQNHIVEDDITFMISPRINAASRMGIPMRAFELLSTQDEVQAGELAKYLHGINDERKGIVASIVKEIKQHLEERTERGPVLVIGNPKWKPSLLGLVATSLMDDVSAPIFLWGREDGVDLKGSCRSDGSVSVVALMEEAKDSFGNYGGHDMAGGYTVLPDKVHFLEESLNNAYKKLATGEERPKILIDKKLSFDEVTNETWSMIEKLGPFGVDNPKPLFLFENSIVAGLKQFGKTGNHLELSFKTSRGRPLRAIGFFITPEHFDLPIREGGTVNLVATVEKSMFRNIPELRLRIVDVI